MPPKPESRGTCAYCGETFVKRNASRHLNACPRRLESLRAAEASDRPMETLWHLRAIWLECCGHMSQFTIGGWGGTEVGFSRKADRTFQPGLVLRHLYDFGTTSETDIRVMGARSGKAAGRHPIALLARNVMPEASCQECGRPAAKLCMECRYEEEKTGFLCAEHAKSHPHGDYGDPLPLVNSPRLGMCGYTGPAEPPY